jgi:hypothetical protein
MSDESGDDHCFDVSLRLTVLLSGVHTHMINRKTATFFDI